MSDINGLPPLVPDTLRLEFRQVTGGNALDKPTFGEKFKMAMAKVGGFLGRLGSVLGPMFGPWGMVGSAAAYGLQRFSEGAVNRMYEKKAYQASRDAQSDQVNISQMFTPGFEMQGSGQNPAWSSGGFQNQGYQILNNKVQATAIAVDQFRS